ncbi:MAG: hypothetical protein L7S48_05345 [Candidatus Poseidonia sp.]|nr:hypothetical protein [Poseidonia sp.]
MDSSAIGRLAMQVNLWASLGYGLMLLLIPDVFCDLLKAEAVNTAWLRTIGAALLGTNVVGCWLWLKSPSIDMGKVQFATATLEAVAMATSLMLDEFTAQNIWMVQASVVLAIVVAPGHYHTTQHVTYESA